MSTGFFTTYFRRKDFVYVAAIVGAIGVVGGSKILYDQQLKIAVARLVQHAAACQSLLPQVQIEVTNRMLTDQVAPGRFVNPRVTYYPDNKPCVVDFVKTSDKRNLGRVVCMRPKLIGSPFADHRDPFASADECRYKPATPT